jgi:3-oxoadipate enol-lactonase
MPKTNVHGLNMYYELSGEGETLVLIGGLGGDHQDWMMQVPAFSVEGYRCLVFDNRDTGQTDESPEASYTIRRFAEDTVGLMDQLDIPRAYVLGDSMGGLIGQEMAINYPEHVRSLTLACTSPICDSFGCAFIGLWKSAMPKLTPEENMQWLLTSTLTYRYFERPGAVQRLAQGKLANPFPQSAAGFKRQCEAVMAFDALDRLVRIACPTHVIVGTEDIVTEKIPGSKLTVIPESGHLVHIEKTSEFNQAVLGFLKSL